MLCLLCLLCLLQIPYRCVEVNPLTKAELKWSEYKKVPVILIDGQQASRLAGYFVLMVGLALKALRGGVTSSCGRVVYETARSWAALVMANGGWVASWSPMAAEQAAVPLALLFTLSSCPHSGLCR